MKMEHTLKITISGVIDLNSGREFKFYSKTSIMCIVLSLAQSILFCFNYKGRARHGHFMLRRQGTPGERIKICSSSKDEAREGLSMLTVPRDDISGAIH